MKKRLLLSIFLMAILVTITATGALAAPAYTNKAITTAVILNVVAHPPNITNTDSVIGTNNVAIAYNGNLNAANTAVGANNEVNTNNVDRANVHRNSATVNTENANGTATAATARSAPTQAPAQAISDNNVDTANASPPEAVNNRRHKVAHHIIV